jgi:hypothetical protein
MGERTKHAVALLVLLPGVPFELLARSISYAAEGAWWLSDRVCSPLVNLSERIAPTDRVPFEERG